MLGDTQQHTGQHSRPPRSGRGDDDAHGCVHLLHRQRPGDGVGEHGARQGTHRSGQQRGVAADQATDAPQISGESMGHRASHDFEGPPQRVFHLGPGAESLLRFRAETEFAEGNPCRFGIGDRVREGVVFHAILGIERSSRTAEMAPIISTAA
jgi:hypothetical protein